MTGQKSSPIEIMTFKQMPAKRNYQSLNRMALWKADPLNRKYGLELSHNPNTLDETATDDTISMSAKSNLQVKE